MFTVPASPASLNSPSVHDLHSDANVVTRGVNDWNDFTAWLEVECNRRFAPSAAAEQAHYESYLASCPIGHWYSDTTPAGNKVFISCGDEPWYELGTFAKYFDAQVAAESAIRARGFRPNTAA